MQEPAIELDEEQKALAKKLNMTDEEYKLEATLLKKMVLRRKIKNDMYNCAYILDRPPTEEEYLGEDMESYLNKLYPYP